MHKVINTFIFAASISTLISLSPVDSSAMPKAGNAPPEAQTISGTVVETMNSSGYTYLLVASGAGENWVAVPETTVEQGATVHYYEGMMMREFTSKGLGKTFDSIIFSSGLGTAPESGSAAPASDDSFAAAINNEQSKSQARPAPLPESSGGSSGAVVPFSEIVVEKSEAANGYKIEEIFAKAIDLNGKKIQVRGKVVKFSPMIMGTNWLHIQDGSGNPMHNSHDLVITSDETVDVGQVVVLEGILSSEKDFGAGYKYAAIIEKATVVK